MTPLFSIGVGSLLCFIPLALYFLFLASLNRRRRPTMVSGRWDYACLLLGLSGFILIGSPILVSTVDSGWRSVWFAGNFAKIRDVWGTSGMIMLVVATLYLLTLATVIGTFMYLRGKVTMVYNVDPEKLPENLTAVLDERGLHWRAVLGGFEVARSRRKPNDDADLPVRLRDPAFVSISPFRALRHASLNWRCNDSLMRSDIETELDKLLQTSGSPANPAAGWFMSAAVTMFLVTLMWMVFLVWILLAHPKGF